MYEIDRMAAVIKPTEHFLAWVNEVSQTKELVSLEELQHDCTVLLLPLLDDPSGAEEYIRDIYIRIFENELEAWCLDEQLWPQRRNYQLFGEWFKIEYHSYVFDLVPADDSDDEFVSVTLQ